MLGLPTRLGRFRGAGARPGECVKRPGLPGRGRSCPLIVGRPAGRTRCQGTSALAAFSTAPRSTAAANASPNAASADVCDESSACA